MFHNRTLYAAQDERRERQAGVRIDMDFNGADSSLPQHCQRLAIQLFDLRTLRRMLA